MAGRSRSIVVATASGSPSSRSSCASAVTSASRNASTRSLPSWPVAPMTATRVRTLSRSKHSPDLAQDLLHVVEERHPLDVVVARMHEVDVAVRLDVLDHLLDRLLHVDERPESELDLDALAAHAVGARLEARVIDLDLDLLDRPEGLAHPVRELEDAIVLLYHVEDSPAHLLVGRFDACDIDARQVAHVDERAPHLAASVHRQLALGERVAHERVDDQIVPHARAPAVHR